MKKKGWFWKAVLLLIVSYYLIWKLSWWYEDRQLEKVRLEELIALVKQPALRDKEILHFYGTHAGYERDHTVSRFIFYSEGNVVFNSMKENALISKENASKNRMEILNLTRSMIKGESGTDPLAIDEMVSYELVGDKFQLKIDVARSKKGFYIRTENLEKKWKKRGR